MIQGAVRSTSSEELEARLLLAVIFLFALLVRVAVIGGTVGFQTPGAAEPSSDSRIHLALVQSLLAGRGYSLDGPTGITPPLYIFLLAGLYRVLDSPAAVRLFQAILAAGGCVLLYIIGQRLFDHLTGLVAAGLLSLYPIAAYLPGLHLTENLFLPLVLLIIWQSLRVAERPTGGSGVVLGLLLGMAILTRAIFLAFLPFVLAWAMVLWGLRDGRTYRTFAVITMVALLVVSPWTIRNYAVFRAFVPVQSNGGMVFWAGNNPHSDGGMVWPTRKTWTATKPPNDNMYGWRNLDVSQENALYIRTALTWIQDHPDDYLRLLGGKLVRLYGFTRATDERGLNVPAPLRLLHLGFIATAMIGMATSLRSRRQIFLLFALVAFVNLMTLIFSGATRYAIPMLPSLALFAAVPLATWWRRLNGEAQAEE